MASSFEKSVKGATKIKAAPPKTKYIEHILIATHTGEAGVGEVFRALQNRLHDSTWTVVFKSLITTHVMIREGAPDVTLAYLAKHRNMLAVSMFSDAQTQGRNIRHYANYLQERARAYRDTKIDWVRATEPRLEKLSVEKGLLRETEAIQDQLTALLKCDVVDHEPENEITIFVFRLLVLDLLQLFQVLNQAMINILGHFFEMSKPDAERAMDIYRTFTRQTDFVVQYLSIARQYAHHTRVEVPKLKHAPVNLGRQLEEYLKDPDFEIHRRQYLAELEAKKSKGASGASSSKLFKNEPASKADTAKAFSTANGSQQKQPSKPAEPTKGPDQDLIDFFDSIEQNQTPMAVQPQPQAQQPPPPLQTGANLWANNGFQMQPSGQIPTNGFMPPPAGFLNSGQPNMTGFVQQPQLQPMQTNLTGAGFGGFSPQPAFQPTSLSPIPQASPASFQTASPTGFQTLQTPQQTTNPFRQSMLMTGQMMGQPTSPAVQQSFSPNPQPLQRQATNPFARTSPPAATPTFASPTSTTGNAPFQTQSPTPQQHQPLPLQAMPTGTNPFAKNFGQPLAQPPHQQQQQQQQSMPTGGGLVPQPTGTTNPFRQGAFVNHNTGMGWQNHQQPIGGGLDQLETVPVFPRPATQTPWQQ